MSAQQLEEKAKSSFVPRIPGSLPFLANKALGQLSYQKLTWGRSRLKLPYQKTYSASRQIYMKIENSAFLIGPGNSTRLNEGLKMSPPHWFSADCVGAAESFRVQHSVSVFWVFKTFGTLHPVVSP